MTNRSAGRLRATVFAAFAAVSAGGMALAEMRPVPRPVSGAPGAEVSALASVRPVLRPRPNVQVQQALPRQVAEPSRPIALHRVAVTRDAAQADVPLVPAVFDGAPQPAAPTVPEVSKLAPVASARPRLRPRVQEMPDLRWDHIRGSDRWTRAIMRALDSHGQRLVETVPRDIAQWCPSYPEAGEWERKAFWAGLLSTLSKHESTYRPTAVGGGGLWYGLVQILPATARGYGCRARTGEALKDGQLNMSCAVRIMNVTVPRDNVVSHGMRGVAADWGPFHSSRKREDMRRWLVRQPYCNGLHQSMRPVVRPDWAGTVAGEALEVPLFVAWELDKQFHDAQPSWPGPNLAFDAEIAVGETDG